MEEMSYAMHYLVARDNNFLAWPAQSKPGAADGADAAEGEGERAAAATRGREIYRREPAAE